MMQHDPRLLDAARAIYDACYPTEGWSLFPFEDAEKYGTVEYRQAVARAEFMREGEQLLLPVA